MADSNKKKYIKYEDTTYILEDHRLPDPTAEDNGKVLGVVDGAYALKQEEGGGGAVTSVNGKTGAVTLSASDVHALPDSTVIPAAVTEQTVSGWGFTKNTGTYSKPTGGIPASDLAPGVIPTGVGGLTGSQIAAIAALFQLAVYAEDPSDAFDAFIEAFPIYQDGSALTIIGGVTASLSGTTLTLS